MRVSRAPIWKTRQKDRGWRCFWSPTADMELQIGKQKLRIKDYYCADGDGIYLPREDAKLWLYVHLTDACNASCPFCVNAVDRRKSGAGTISLRGLEECLVSLSDRIGGVSITGGEPMLYPELTDKAAQLVMDILPDAMLDLATNGTNLERIPQLQSLDAFEGIHVSRHSPDDETNDRIFGRRMPSAEEIRRLLLQMSDPAKIVFNCVMQKGLVDSEEAVASYLETAAAAGVRNTSFIGMFRANAYCREKYVSPALLELKDPRFHIWNHFRDHDYCACSSGSYDAAAGPVRFYYRCPGSGKAPYTRQLVYTADDRLLAGFGGDEILWRNKRRSR